MSNRCLSLILLPVLLAVILSYFYMDRSIAVFVHQHTDWYQSHGLKLITLIGSWPIVISCLVLCYMVSWLRVKSVKLRQSLFQIFLVVVLGNLVVLVFKMLCGRARPKLWLNDGVYGFYGPSYHHAYWSFPSGHTVTVMGMAWTLCLLMPKYTIAWLILGTMVIASRVLLLQHYFSDVVMGVYIALFVSILVNRYRQLWLDKI